jgi:hypothetical protein
MSKSTKILISFIVLVLLLISSQGQCQITKRCPQVDSLNEKWAFVNCETQEQVLPYVYVQVGYENIGNRNIENIETWGNSEFWEDEQNNQHHYFWSKFATDSLIIVDTLGTVIFKVSKQKYPTIEKIKFVNDEFFQFLWRDTTQVNNFMQEFNMSMFLSKKGNEFKPKNMTNISVREIDKIGVNYRVYFYTLPKKENKQLRKYILIDKEGNKLSKAYSYISSTINKGIIEVVNEPIWFFSRFMDLSIKIRNRKIGFINLAGKLIIPIKFDNYYSGYTNKFIILRKKNKYGVLDTKGKTILPFKYHNLRQIDSTLFVAQDNDTIGSEYVINTEKKILTKPVFYAISSFKNDTVYQNWNKAALAYNTNGECISSKEEQEQKELFMLFIKETKTQKLYQLKNLSKVKSYEVELVFISSNHYQYKSQVAATLLRKWYKKVVNKIDFRYYDVIKNINFPVRITEIQMLNTQTSEKTALKGTWEYEFNKKW